MYFEYIPKLAFPQKKLQADLSGIKDNRTNLGADWKYRGTHIEIVPHAGNG